MRRGACAAAVTAAVCFGSQLHSHAAEDTRAASAPEARQAFFGDLHMHTWWSFDAYALGVRVGPEEAYRYARGEAIEHVSGEPIRLEGPPLDFMALTEHSEYMGVSALANQPDHPVRQLPLIAALVSDDAAERSSALSRFAGILAGSEPIPELLTDEVVQPVWRRLVELADEHDEPGVFTAFVGYEWTSMPAGQNLHRNVIFADNRVPERPFSSIDSADPEDLWTWMDRARQSGSDLIAIPHNGNTSNGLMYATTDSSGNPIDAAYAGQRVRNEPVSEVFQIKGQSETHPQLSPDDEWAGFEQFDRILGDMSEPSKPAGSFVRDALRTGLEMAPQGFNPYEIGVVGSSDGHNASSPTEETNYTGKIGIADGTPTQRLLEDLSNSLPVEAVSRWGAAGLAGVWADENTRPAIFDALRRRETFATSGPRIRPRFFAGFDLRSEDVDQLVTAGYQRGAPMGSRIVGRSEAAPVFLYWAFKDPNGADLERVQIVKLWEEGGRSHERVVDVACSGDVEPRRGRCPAPVAQPKADCVPNRGAAELKGSWQDDEYRSTGWSAYYVRVLEVPTCRWSTYDAQRLDMAVPDHLPRTIQERAVSSAVWIAPASEADQSNSPAEASASRR